MTPQPDATRSSYSNPLIQRYTSTHMSSIFSDKFKFSTWRKLWVALAQAQRELGIPITAEQIEEMEHHTDDIDFEVAAAYERETRHDVMAHVKEFGDKCPRARGIIHLGATSAFVGDNTDLIQIRDASKLVLQRLAQCIETLSHFARTHAHLPTLGFTHFQPAQLTTVGKRAALWLYDLMCDYEQLIEFHESLKFRGVKGTTGTQASFLKLFDGDYEKVKKLDHMVARQMGFDDVLPVCGQTYTRKIDAQLAAILSLIAQSMHKLANDIRLLQHLKEVEEPFGSSQIGSSAMAYKRNPMRSERMTALARYVITSAQSPAQTAAEQWFERTLDDSANKRISIAQMCCATDAICIICQDIASGLRVYPKMIERRIMHNLPFMATENILMEAVRRGGDRQQLHEKIRIYSQQASDDVKLHGAENTLIDKIAADSDFNMSAEQIHELLEVKAFIGAAPMQTEEFLSAQVAPLLERARTYGDPPEGKVRV